VHFSLVAPEAVLGFYEDGIGCPCLGLLKEAGVAGPLGRGARELRVCVDVGLENDAAESGGGLPTQSHLVVGSRWRAGALRCSARRRQPQASRRAKRRRQGIGRPDVLNPAAKHVAGDDQGKAV
jgi:hypothetical protein